MDRTSLAGRLAEALPKDYKFKLYHLSTPPTETSALYSAPPKGRPVKTFCESHYVTVSIDAGESRDVLVFAIEVLIYSTEYSSTFFVSKADSTGYLHLLNLPKGCPSPLRTISTIVLTFLVEKRQRPGIQNIISLFARAQDQYLFPGSIENSGKHVLDDRGLVRWWCKTLDPLVEDGPRDSWRSVKGYLIVPGMDKYETISYLPRKTTSPNWIIGHPLVEISAHPDAPPRCLVPHFPDDPKSRFLDELDDEPSGRWTSVRSLDQFWEMMAYRQECSAGRLVGFIWVVFDPKDDRLPRVRKPLRKRPKKRLTGPIIPRQPRVKTKFNQPTQTAHYSWPSAGRGQIVLEEKDYKRATELLLRLDFADINIAHGSSVRWIEEIRGQAADWGEEIKGEKEFVIAEASTNRSNQVNVLSTNMVRKKKKT